MPSSQRPDLYTDLVKGWTLFPSSAPTSLASPSRGRKLEDGPKLSAHGRPLFKRAHVIVLLLFPWISEMNSFFLISIARNGTIEQISCLFLSPE